MITPADITVIVITKNRLTQLQALLRSMAKLSHKPGDIIIISSSDDREAEQAAIRQLPTIRVKLIYQPPTGYPAARNKGVKEAVGKVIAFVDDDCRVPANWITEIVRAHNHVGADGIVMGSVRSLPKDNFWAQVAQMHYDNWIKTICRNGICSTLDAKVTSFDKGIFTRHGCWFNEALMTGSEDIEFGYRLYQAGLKILYQPQIYFFHFERTSLIEVLRQRWRIAKSEVVVARYIDDYDLVDMLPPTKLKKLIPRAVKKLVSWCQTKKILWSIRYVGVLPLFFVTRTAGYWWGSRR